MSMSAIARLSGRCLRRSAFTPPQIPARDCLRLSLLPDLQPMGTWTDKLRRWQSGAQAKKGEGKVTGDEGKKGETQEKAAEMGPDGEVSSDPPSEEKESVLEQKEKEIASLKDKYMRALADAENVRTRMRKQVEEAKLFGIQGFSKDVLDVADVLQKATESIPASELDGADVNPSLRSIFEGLKMTESELQKVFTKNGLKKIDPVGEDFDPVFHEALFEVPGDKPGTVAVVSRSGYTLHGRTIRPARVGVVKALETES